MQCREMEINLIKECDWNINTVQFFENNNNFEFEILVIPEHSQNHEINGHFLNMCIH